MSAKLKEYGLKKRPDVAEMWLGITTDEWQRMKDADVKWVKNRFPLIERRMSRMDCITWLESKDLPVPDKSGCVFCPFTNNKTWSKMKKNNPNDFEIAVKADKALRDIGKKIKGCSDIKYYLHPSLMPLEDIEFEDNQLTLDGFDCEGHCGL